MFFRNCSLAITRVLAKRRLFVDAIAIRPSVLRFVRNHFLILRVESGRLLADGQKTLLAMRTNVRKFLGFSVREVALVRVAVKPRRNKRR